MATIITNAGRALVAGRFLPGAESLSLYVGWGTGGGTAAAEDKALSSEAPEARQLAEVTQATTDTANDTVQFIGTIKAEGNRTITNAGLFTAPANGDLLMKTSFAGLPIEKGDSITFHFSFSIQEQ